VFELPPSWLICTGSADAITRANVSIIGIRLNYYTTSQKQLKLSYKAMPNLPAKF